ncbi:MAG: hypothetical protein J5I52_05195 [Saprospiraceae bacterium]|nr:MAG: hypothetical protein UZ09_BCD002002085 [Bacteroidetes bacterium OLB9]MCO6463527.1 hypothetical protein [Saprospiraceae bacterium]
MAEKQKLIEAFKSLDFEALQNLLDDNRSYMRVSKDLFLSRLKQKVDVYEDLKSYDVVVEGICNHCYKGCKAYKFKAKNLPSLPLFFEEEDGKVTDICICNDLIEDNPDEDDWRIMLKFCEDEKVDFKPSLEYNMILQLIDEAVEAFYALNKKGVATIEGVVDWYNQNQNLASAIGLDLQVFFGLQYKAYEHIASIYSKVSDLVSNFERNDVAKNALEAYHKISADDEKSLVKWLLDNADNHFYELQKTDYWERTGLLILETNPNLLVDCSGYLEGFLLREIYTKHFDEMMEKYQPTMEHYMQHGGWIDTSLKNYLKVHNKYLDLL